ECAPIRPCSSGVEHSLGKGEVGGSNPPMGSTLSPRLSCPRIALRRHPVGASPEKRSRIQLQLPTKIRVSDLAAILRIAFRSRLKPLLAYRYFGLSTPRSASLGITSSGCPLA